MVRKTGELRALADALAGAGGLTETANAFDERDALRAFAAAISRVGEGSAVVDERILSRALAAASDRPLTEEQAAAVRAVATSGNGVDVIEALAGTGKTFIAGTLRQVYEDAGYHVVGIARRPAGRCASSPRRPGSRCGRSTAG